MPDLIVLTGASGKQCAHLIPHLYSNPTYTLRLVVHTEASLNRLKSRYPKAEVIRVDLTQPAACIPVLTGATTAFHVGPPFHPQETEIGINVVAAAVAESNSPESHFKHFVLSSVACPQLRKMLNHDRKRYIEEYLIESGLNYTILNPTHLMDPYLGAMLAQKGSEAPVFKAAWNPRVKFSFLALKDLGEAATKVIGERERHYFAQYPLSSTGAMSYNEVVSKVSSMIGTEIRVEQMGYEESVNVVLQRIFGTDKVDQRLRDGPERMLLFYNRRGLIANPTVLEILLGRKGLSPEDWVTMQMARSGDEK